LATFGYTEEGENFESVSNRIVGSKFLTGQDGVVDSIFAYIRAQSSNVKFKCAIYDYESMSLIGVTEERSGLSSEPAWIQFTFPEPKPQVENDKNYVLAVWASEDDGNIGEIAYSSGENGLYLDLAYNSFPDTLSGYTELDDRKHSIYAYYTPIPPSEYGSTVNSLKSFRDQILDDMVRSRIEARLSASHETMQKYANVIDSMSVVAYLFGRLRDYAMALSFKGMNVGGGKLFRLQQTYTGGLTEYPKGTSPPVTPRALPQVDEYLFETITDLELLEQTDLSNLQSFIVIQADNDTFEEPPDAENYRYDYYAMYPLAKFRCEYDILNPEEGFGGIEKLKGERTVMERELTVKGTTERYIYYFHLFLNPIVTGAGEIKLTPTVLVWIPEYPSGAPDVVISIAGQRVRTGFTGVWATLVAITPTPAPQQYVVLPHGWSRIAGDLAIVSETEVWRAFYNVTVEVNDETKGTTDPAPDTYNVTAGGDFTVTALPNAGYTFDHWEVDGVNRGSANPITVKIRKPTRIVAVFT